MKFQNAISAVGAIVVGMLLVVDSAWAATFTGTLGGETYTFVELDPYHNGGTPGNTLRETPTGNPATEFWSNTGTMNHSDGLWFADTTYTTWNSVFPSATNRSFNIHGGTSGGATDINNAPALKVTVGGLAPGEYEAFLVYIYRNDGWAQTSGQAAVRANLNGPAASGTVYNHATPGLVSISNVPAWGTGLASLGNTAFNATGFSVHITGVPVYHNINPIAVAYQLVQPVPEPASFSLAGLSLIAAMGWVRARRLRRG